MISNNQTNQYKTKISEFRQQINLVIKGILKMFWEDVMNIREQFVLFEVQQKNNIESYRIEMADKVRQYANLVNNKLKEAYNTDSLDLRNKLNKELGYQKDEWEQKCRKLELDLMSLEAQRQMEKA